MNKRLLSSLVLAFMCAAALLPSRASAQLSGGLTAQQLWVDPATGQVFIRPGRNRVPLTITGAGGPTSAQIDQQVQQQVDTKMQAAESQFQAQQNQLVASNQQLQAQVTQMNTGWKSYMDNWGSKVKIGTLLYGDYALYTHTSYGPQFLENLNPPGYGNNMYNSFDINRSYLNFIFQPTNDWTVRLTPEGYRTTGTATAQTEGASSSIGSNLTGDFGVRMKFAYLRYNSPLKFWDATKTDTVTVGMQSQPFNDWEEQMFGYRFVTEVPWNLMGFSSSYIGASMQGPIIFDEKQYVDYDFGVYNDGNFHSSEFANTKNVMARLSAYPFGARWRYDGLGLTGFIDYGWGNVTPDVAQLPTATKGPNSVLYRTAAILHYTTEQFGIAAEFDYGKNSVTEANMFSGSIPAGPQASLATMTTAILNQGKAIQEGFDLFGHYHIPNTPFSIFGLYQWELPNTNANNPDPLDFERFVAGVAYQYNEYLRFALDSQNLSYYHNQETFSGFGLAKPVPNAVMRDIHSIFLNVEFNY